MKLSLVALFSLALGSGQAAADTLTLVADPWCPYTCDSQEKPGYLIELARTILESAGHKVEYKVVPWARAITDARKGTWAGVVGAFRADAPDFSFPALEQGVATNCFYTTPQSSWTYSGISSLSDRTIGAVVDYAYEDGLDVYIKANAGKKIQLVPGNDALVKNAKKTLSGRIDAFIDDRTVVQHFAKTQGVALREAGCLERVPLFVAISPALKNGPQLAKLLSDNMESLRRSGKLAEILKRYEVEDWQR